MRASQGPRLSVPSPSPFLLPSINNQYSGNDQDYIAPKRGDSPIILPINSKGEVDSSRMVENEDDSLPPMIKIEEEDEVA